MEEDYTFKAGDIVKIKSGQMKLTISYYTKGNNVASCVWELDGKFHTDSFPISILESAE